MSLKTKSPKENGGYWIMEIATFIYAPNQRRGKSKEAGKKKEGGSSRGFPGPCSKNKVGSTLGDFSYIEGGSKITEGRRAWKVGGGENSGLPWVTGPSFSKLST